jgi:hypothetical protein
MQGRSSLSFNASRNQSASSPRSAIIQLRHAMAFRREKRQPLHLRIGQPEKVARHVPRQFGGLKHAGREVSSRTIGPGPRRRQHHQHSARTTVYPEIALPDRQTL